MKSKFNNIDPKIYSVIWRNKRLSFKSIQIIIKKLSILNQAKVFEWVERIELNSSIPKVLFNKKYSYQMIFNYK